MKRLCRGDQYKDASRRAKNCSPLFQPLRLYTTAFENCLNSKANKAIFELKTDQLCDRVIIANKYLLYLKPKLSASYTQNGQQEKAVDVQKAAEELVKKVYEPEAAKTATATFKKYKADLEKSCSDVCVTTGDAKLKPTVVGEPTVPQQAVTKPL